MTEDVKTYVYKLEMKCMNCIKKISKVLDEMKDNGIKEYNIKFEEQQVEVKTTLPVEEILNVLKSTGKQVTIVSSS